jgi:anaerobic selenocysteine-containing dehydrogenase/Fe-S-cluster-containing dehydrogenase component
MPDVSRRTFLRIAAAAGAVASVPGCKPAARQLIPYVIPDETIVPGEPSFYAGICGECPAGCGTVARVREGRVIKLEGNPNHPVSGGAICARGQAGLQALYNPDRLPKPHQRGTNRQLQPITWDAANRTLIERLKTAATAGKNRVALMGAPAGPTLGAIIDRWLHAWNSDRLVLYQPLDDEPAHVAAHMCYGRSDLPFYQIDSADVLLSFGADFLETWRSPVEMTRQYAQFRTPRRQNGGVTIGYSAYVGPRFGLTAARSDDWLAARPGSEAIVALGVLHELLQANPAPAPGIDLNAIRGLVNGYDPASVAARSGVPADKITLVAKRFAEAPNAVALAGTDEAATHVAAMLLNAIKGSIGKSVRFLEGGGPQAPSSPQEMTASIDAMRSGKVDLLVVTGVNPMFTMAPEAGFAEAIKHVPFVVWAGGVPDESAEAAHLLLPIHHPMETWGDSMPRAGVYGLGQPAMQPVFESRPLGDILLDCARAGTVEGTLWDNTAHAVEANWRDLHKKSGLSESFDEFWEKARRSGGWFAEAKDAQVSLKPETLQTPMQIQAPAAGLTMIAFPHIFFFDGRGADKPWLQEIPEPVAQIVWDSWAEIHPATAKRLDIAEGDIVELRSPHGRIEVAAHIFERAQPDVIAVPLGQGHETYGRYASGIGCNPWHMLADGQRSARVELGRTGRSELPVSPLGLSSMLDRPIVETISLEDLSKGIKPPPFEEEPPEPYEAYEKYTYDQHQWGMTIDVNACTGCSACVAACYAENNIPFVGKKAIDRGRIMSWIRMERYFPEKNGGPPIQIMPMLCQQCDHAPCEPVCPVFAAYHTDEGLNGQIYNRCVGTRYCENNCPYKVRRFNWFKPDFPAPLNLQLNPDVTVRGAGVMEKCTFCIQRIRAAEMNAEVDGNRALNDGEIVPACAQACPARAITFGDIKDPKSAMMRRREENDIRAYRSLEHLNTQPSIVYLRNVYRSGEKA